MERNQQTLIQRNMSSELVCPECGLELVPLFSDDEGKQPLTLQYGKRHEPAFECSNSECFEMWTETSIRLYRDMKEKQRERSEV